MVWQLGTPAAYRDNPRTNSPRQGSRSGESGVSGWAAPDRNKPLPLLQFRFFGHTVWLDECSPPLHNQPAARRFSARVHDPEQAICHAAVDFAACMRYLTDVHYPKAERIRVDNLSTHSAGELYEALPACETRRVLDRLKFHYVPKRASWLNTPRPPHRGFAGASSPKSLHGNDSKTRHAPVSNECSPSPAQNWAAPISVEPISGAQTQRVIITVLRYCRIYHSAKRCQPDKPTLRM